MASNRKNRKRIVQVMLGALVGLLVSCGDEPKKVVAIAPAVSVYIVSSDEIGQYLEFVARTEAYQTTKIVARVQGELIQRLFEEGTFVEKDQLLFKIDPEEFKASLSQVEADLASKTVGAQNAKRNLLRGKELSETGYISQVDLDTLITTSSQANASVMAAQASLEKAALNLAYTQIKAPFAGQIGKAGYDVGSVVGPQGSPLATLNAVDPINVTFQVEEGRYLTYLQNSQKQIEGSSSDLSIRLPNNTLYAEKGTINFSGTKIDEGMGTVGLRAEFPNPDGLVLPGLFVTLIVESEDKQTMSLVPQVAVQENQQGKFVLVVDEENRVSTRIVRLERRINAMWVVETGLQDGEQVIIEGLQKVRPGVVVKPIIKTVDKLSGTISSSESDK